MPAAAEDSVFAILVRFFKAEFAEDPAGVGEWLEAQGVDVDEFAKELGL